MKIKISISAYNEIATALERYGIKADGTTELTIEKGTQLACPVDFKMVTIRRDVAAIAKDCYKDEKVTKGSFVIFCDELMNWIMTDKEYNNTDVNTMKLTAPKARNEPGGWT